MVHGLHNRGLLDSQWVLFSHYPLYSTSRYWPEHTVMWIVSLKDIVFTVDLLSELNTLTFTFIAEFWHVLSAHIPSCALRLWMKGQPLSVCWRSQLNKSLIVKGNSEFIHLTQMCILYCDRSAALGKTCGKNPWIKKAFWTTDHKKPWFVATRQHEAQCNPDPLTEGGNWRTHQGYRETMMKEELESRPWPTGRGWELHP